MKMKTFIVSWYASGYTGSFNYLVVAKNIEEAKAIWKNFVTDNKEIMYSWKKAEKAVHNHHGGYITWKETGESNKETGCYELPYEEWNVGSDHLQD